MTLPRRCILVLLILTAALPLAGPAGAARARAAQAALPVAGPTPRPTPTPTATAIPGPDQNPLPDPLGVAAGILVDPGTGRVLWQANATLARPPASLTKIMTALVVLNRGDLGPLGTITDDAFNAGGSESFAPVGTTMTVGDLLWGLLLISGNDFAITLAHTLSPDGSMAGFMNMMNHDAASLGATSSHFANPDGLPDPGQVSTARDMALLTMVAMDNPLFAQIVASPRHDVTWGGRSHSLFTHNKLLTLYPGTIGVKTGYTLDAGNCLVSEVERNGTRLLAVVLGARTLSGYKESEALYDWGFANLAALEAASTDRITPGHLPAPGGAGGPASRQPKAGIRHPAEAQGTVPASGSHRWNTGLAVVALVCTGLVLALFAARFHPQRS